MEDFLKLNISSFPSETNDALNLIKENIEWVLSEYNRTKHLQFSIHENSLYLSILEGYRILGKDFEELEWESQGVEPYSNTTINQKIIELYFQKMIAVFLVFEKDYANGIKSEINYVNSAMDSLYLYNKPIKTIDCIDNFLYERIYKLNPDNILYKILIKMHYTNYYHNYINIDNAICS